jgi:hypothetical protein
MANERALLLERRWLISEMVKNGLKSPSKCCSLIQACFPDKSNCIDRRQAKRFLQIHNKVGFSET